MDLWPRTRFPELPQLHSMHRDRHFPDNDPRFQALRVASSFAVQIEERLLKSLLPEDALPWIDRSNPRLYILKAER